MLKNMISDRRCHISPRAQMTPLVLSAQASLGDSHVFSTPFDQTRDWDECPAIPSAIARTPARTPQVPHRGESRRDTDSELSTSSRKDLESSSERISTRRYSLGRARKSLRAQPYGHAALHAIGEANRHFPTFYPASARHRHKSLLFSLPLPFCVPGVSTGGVHGQISALLAQPYCVRLICAMCSDAPNPSEGVEANLLPPPRLSSQEARLDDQDLHTFTAVMSELDSINSPVLRFDSVSEPELKSTVLPKPEGESGLGELGLQGSTATTTCQLTTPNPTLSEFSPRLLDTAQMFLPIKTSWPRHRIGGILQVGDAVVARNPITRALESGTWCGNQTVEFRSGQRDLVTPLYRDATRLEEAYSASKAIALDTLADPFLKTALYFSALSNRLSWMDATADYDLIPITDSVIHPLRPLLTASQTELLRTNVLLAFTVIRMNTGT